jgi:hypothetical protein
MNFLQMNSVSKCLVFLCLLYASAVNCLALDREAFTFTSYDLKVQVDPEQHRLGVRGKLTLRNDSPAPQKIAVLQISSSLDWRSIKAGDKSLQFLSQPYTSDIDHTGALAEAIITLPQPVSPQGTIDLEIAYEGVILLDATRLTRIGTPEESAMSSDWDQIGPGFTAVRGIGYVAWYPIATEVANLSEGNSLFEVLGRWKTREAGSPMNVRLEYPTAASDVTPAVLCSGKEIQGANGDGSATFPWAQCSYQGHSVPSFAIANYGVVTRPSVVVYNLAAHAVAAESYADAAEKVFPLINDWFGTPREKARTVDLADSKAAPFESGPFLLTPLISDNSRLAGLAAAHQLTHAAFFSFRPWLEEGLAHFAQALFLEQEKGRQAALDYLDLHWTALSEIESPAAAQKSDEEASHSLVNTTSEELYRSKAMSVWWMLRDMVGEPALKKAIAAYRPEQDKDPSYMPRLISAQTQRDLEWFFDDWVYRDRGLPDFKVESGFSRKTMTGSFILTITLENLGTAGAEVPIFVKFAGGDVMKRLEVRAKNKAVIRVELPAAPHEIVVNDGSVPESDRANNTFKIEPEPK